MTKKKSSKLTAELLFCDDVRQEKTGKHILVGVYDEKLIVESPSQLDLMMFLRVRGLKQGLHDIAFKLTGAAEGNLKGEGKIEVGDDSKHVTLVTPKARIFVDANCELAFELELDGELVPTHGLSVIIAPKPPPLEP